MPQSTHFILLGASGDLAHKKIIPALATQNNLEITLWSRKVLTYDIPSNYNRIQSDYTSIDTWNDIFSTKQNKHFIVYMALPPVSYFDILKALNASLDGKDTLIDIIIEKPFATDSVNMTQIIELIVNSPVLEKSVRFFDHFLFKVNNKDSLEQFKSITKLDSVTIRSLETIDVIGRVAFYDKTGATRDMLSHLIFFAENYCTGSGLSQGFDWSQYKITKYDILQYPGYNDNPELVGRISNTETYFDLELTNPDLLPSTIRLISGKKQPQKIWDITLNGINCDLIGPLQYEHLMMIEAIQSKNYTKFITTGQAQELWQLIDRIPKNHL